MLLILRPSPTSLRIRLACPDVMSTPYSCVFWIRYPLTLHEKVGIGVWITTDPGAVPDCVTVTVVGTVITSLPLYAAVTVTVTAGTPMMTVTGPGPLGTTVEMGTTPAKPETMLVTEVKTGGVATMCVPGAVPEGGMVEMVGGPAIDTDPVNATVTST